jgi:hypothetical protein
MIVLAYLWSQCTFHRYLGGCADLVMYLAWWIWQRNGIKFYADFGNSATKALAMIRQAFGEESMSHIQRAQTHWDWKRRDRWRTKSRVCSSFSLTSRGLFVKNLPWQAKQSIPYTTVMLYYDCMEMCEDFVLNFGDKRTGCCITSTHHLTLPLSPRNFWPKTTLLSSPPTLLFWRCWTPSQNTTSKIL